MCVDLFFCVNAFLPLPYDRAPHQSPSSPSLDFGAFSRYSEIFFCLSSRKFRLQLSHRLTIRASKVL